MSYARAINNPETFHLLRVRVAHAKLPLPPPHPPFHSSAELSFTRNPTRARVAVEFQSSWPRDHDRNHDLSRTLRIVVTCHAARERYCTNYSTDDGYLAKSSGERNEKKRYFSTRNFHNSEERRGGGFPRGVYEREGRKGNKRRDGKKERKREKETQQRFGIPVAIAWRESVFLFFSHERNFAYLAGCRQGLDVNRLISVLLGARAGGGRHAREIIYLRLGLQGRPRRRGSRSRARPRELTSNNEATLFAPCSPSLSFEIPSLVSSLIDRCCFGKSGRNARYSMG